MRPGALGNDGPDQEEGRVTASARRPPAAGAVPAARGEAALPALHPTGRQVEPLADRVLVYTDDGDATLAAITARGVQPSTMFARRSSLEDVFLLLTGRTLED